MFQTFHSFSWPATPFRRFSSKRLRRNRSALGLWLAVAAALVSIYSWSPSWEFEPGPPTLTSINIERADASDVTVQDTQPSSGHAFLSLGEESRICGQEGELCHCFGHVRFGKFLSWSEDIPVDGWVNCSAKAFGETAEGTGKVCKCFPATCTTSAGTCTTEPCSCPISRDPSYYWGKMTLMTGEGIKCWACDRHPAPPGIPVTTSSPFCPEKANQCSLQACKCESPSATKRVLRTKEGQRCWTCAPPVLGRSLGLDSGQKAMFWMLPMLWPFLDWPNSMWKVLESCTTLSVFLVLCVVGYVLQNFVPILNLNRFFSFYPPCLKKAEVWRLFTYFMLHSDLQHLFMNLMHLIDALDLEGVPAVEVSPGNSLRCTRDGSMSSICYPNVGIGHYHMVMLTASVLAFGALVGTIRNFGAMVQGASSVCFGVDGALIAIYALFLGAGLDHQMKTPDFGAFFWMRIGIIAFHIIVDVAQSAFSGGQDTVGTTAHLASFVAGFCYILIWLPPMGDGELFGESHPYIINCGLTSPKYMTLESATSRCLAFFDRGNGIEVETAQNAATAVLILGVGASLANAVRNRHISDDGIAILNWGGGGGKAPDGSAPQQALLDLHREQVSALREDVTRLGRLLDGLTRVDRAAAPTAAGRGASSTARAAAGSAAASSSAAGADEGAGALGGSG